VVLDRWQRKLDRLGPPPDAPLGFPPDAPLGPPPDAPLGPSLGRPAAPPSAAAPIGGSRAAAPALRAEPVDPIERARIEQTARQRVLIDGVTACERHALRPGSLGPPASLELPGETIDTPAGPLHRIARHFEPAYHHGRAPIARASEVCGSTLAALALDPVLSDVAPRRLLFLDTETTGISGGAGTLAFLIGMAWFEDESLRVEQLLLRRPGEERPLLIRLAERLAACDAIVTYNGKAFDWPLLCTRAVLNRVPLPRPPAHLDLLPCARRVFARRLGSVRLVHLEAEILGMRREHDVDGAEIPQLYWDFVRGAQTSAFAPVIEHNANDVVALAALLAVLAERFERALPAHAPEDRLGIASVALRWGDFDRAAAFAEDAARAGGPADVTVDAWLLASAAARARVRIGAAPLAEVERLLREALDAAAGNRARRAAIHLALAKHFEHAAKNPTAALAHAAHTADVEGEDASARRIARLVAKMRRRKERAASPTSTADRRTRR
jgi:uncharacterized protein YprB with RNaseH-like and TPR domain